MPAGYAPLPTQQPTPEADRELDEAFASEEEDRDDSLTPTHPHRLPPDTPKATSFVPPVYDFERDFDYARPPPGSPPRPSAVALPNDFGNSNGLLPSSPVETPIHRTSLFRRVIGAILPARYARLPTSDGISARVVGGGTQNDGVFANVTAKPSRAVRVRAGDGSVHVMPEETQSNAPPSYAAAQADAVPPYWETTVHAPAGLDTESGMIIDDLPTGSIFLFVTNLFTSFFFQFVGFLLTYLLHTTHAAKFGSRAGLGLTLIQYGFYSRVADDGFGMETPADGTVPETNATSERSFLQVVSTSSEPPPDSSFLNISSREWLSFLLMTLGWFIFLSSLIGFWRVKHWEASIRATQARGPPTVEEIERDIAARQTLENVFDLSELDGPESPQDVIRIPSQQELEEARLERDLRSAGLL